MTDCSAGDSDVYYAVVLFFDSGFSTEVLSGNSIAVECGSNFSDPYGEVRPGPARSLGSRGGKSR